MCPILSFLWKNRNSCTITFAHIKNNPYFCKRINWKQTIHLYTKIHEYDIIASGNRDPGIIVHRTDHPAVIRREEIPELMKGLGKGVKNFKDGMNGMDEDPKDTNEKKEEVASNEKKEK